MTYKIQKIAEILSLPPEKRLRAILTSADPKAIVQSLSDEDVWLTIKKAGEHDSLALVSITTPDQLQYVLDIETWKRDTFEKEKSLHWLSLIKECGHKKLVEWAHQGDADAVVLTFKNFVHVIKKSAPDDDPLEKNWPGHLPPHTVDGVYYYQCPDEHSDEIVRPALETIAKDDHEFFKKLCEALIHELPSNLEESAFTWRTKRLAEKGFLPLEESLHVYQYLNEKQIGALPKRAKMKINEPEVPRRALALLSLGGENYPLLMLGLSKIKDQDLKEEILLEVSATANKAIVADSRPISPETIESCLKKVMGMVNIGLEHISGADPEKSAAVLEEHYVLNLFQAGFSIVSRVRQKAKKFTTTGWPKEIGGDLTILDEPLASKISSVLRKRPLYFLDEFSESPVREFRSIDDVRDVNRCIEYAEFIGNMFDKVFKLKPLQARALTATDVELLRWSNVLLTVWAKGIATGDYRFSPLAPDELKRALKKSLPSIEAEEKKFAKWLLDRQPELTSDEKKACQQFVNECFGKFIEEFGELSDKETPDWRFVRSIWIIPGMD